jgi:hypothetical protein
MISEFSISRIFNDFPRKVNIIGDSLKNHLNFQLDNLVKDINMEGFIIKIYGNTIMVCRVNNSYNFGIFKNKESVDFLIGIPEHSLKSIINLQISLYLDITLN